MSSPTARHDWQHGDQAFFASADGLGRRSVAAEGHAWSESLTGAIENELELAAFDWPGTVEETVSVAADFSDAASAEILRLAQRIADLEAADNAGTLSLVASNVRAGRGSQLLGDESSDDAFAHVEAARDRICAEEGAPLAPGEAEAAIARIRQIIGMPRGDVTAGVETMWRKLRRVSFALEGRLAPEDVDRFRLRSPEEP